MRQHIVLTASGKDRPGIVEQVTKLLVDHDANVEASRMARLGGEFAILMLVSIPQGSLDELLGALDELKSGGFDVHSRFTESGDTLVAPGSTPCGITVMGADHLGIVHEVARYLAEQGINVDTMDTDVVAAPMSGSPLFTMSAVVRIPQEMSVDDLRVALDEVAEEVGVGVAIQPRTVTEDQ